MEKKESAQNKGLSSAEKADLQARTEAAEANERSLAAALIREAGPEALVNATLPRPGKLVRVQFLRQYSFGGLPAARYGDYVAAPFSAREGDIVDMPEALYDRLQRKYETANPLMESDSKKWVRQTLHRLDGFDRDSGKPKVTAVHREPKQLEEEAVPVGLPKAKQVG